MLLLRLGFSQAAPTVRVFLEGLTDSERVSSHTVCSISPTFPLLLTAAFAQSCLALCDSLDCSTPGSPALHCGSTQLL